MKDWKERNQNLPSANEDTTRITKAGKVKYVITGAVSVNYYSYRTQTTMFG